MSLLVVSEKEHHDSYRSLPVKQEIITCCFHEIVSLIADHCADVLLIDSGFEAGRGLQFLRDIKILRPEIPIIFLTDASSEDVVMKAFKSGAREYFRKPVEMSELGATVSCLIEFRSRTREKRTPLPPINSMADQAFPDKPLNILNVIHYIEKNISEELCLTRLAQESNLSKYHFCRTFKKHTGATPKQFITTIRIERAKMLLKANGSSITEIAAEVGFNDSSNFTRQFKKLIGKNPSAYKNSLSNLHFTY